MCTSQEELCLKELFILSPCSKSCSKLCTNLEGGSVCSKHLRHRWDVLMLQSVLQPWWFLLVKIYLRIYCCYCLYVVILWSHLSKTF